MLLKSETYRHQEALAQYCRDGISVNIPGTKAERLPTYRRLVFNVVKDTIESAFPITYEHLKDDHWDEIIYRFFSNHNCQTPQIWKLPYEFMQFYLNTETVRLATHPYLDDLLLFEWLEIELYMMEDISYPNYKLKGDWVKDIIAINPEYRLIKLEYPVHISPPSRLIDQKGVYFLLMFREKESGRIQFNNLSALFAFIIETLSEHPKPMEEIYADIIHLFGVNDIQLLHNKVTDFLNHYLDKGFILGFRKH
ncbi:hypothetical protein EYV94_23535 [Puteibacter caeruleilacunae]|nr:hypothetical protein EYV94_23535 [Puteibacter caeruleilacunae]